MKNLLCDIPQLSQEERFDDLLQGRAFRAERIVSFGNATPAGQWYDQPQDEWVVLLAGAARLEFEQPSRMVDMRPGDYLNLPAHQRHRVAWTDPQTPSVWLAIHYQPHDDPAAPETPG